MAARAAARPRDRDALRTALLLLEPAADALNEWMRGFHRTLGSDPIRVRWVYGRSETEPRRRLPLTLEVVGPSGPLCRIGIAPRGARLLMERRLPCGRPLRPRYFDAIEPSENGPRLRNGARIVLRVEALFDDIEAVVLADP
jgi:hypothetical protein